MKRLLQRIKGLSYKTGLVILALCAIFYILSFAQFLLPISLEMKGVLWVILFGLAKTAQYTAILILGKEGVRYFFKSRNKRKS